MSVSTLCWGALTIGTAWAGNYANLMAIRILLGMVEAGLFPCVVSRQADIHALKEDNVSLDDLPTN